MAHEDDLGPGLPRSHREKSVAGLTGCGGQAGRRLGTSPKKAAEIGTEPVRCGLTLVGPGEGLLTQLVIDGKDQERTAMGPGPVRGHQGQGQGISAARQGYGHGPSRVGPQKTVEEAKDLGLDVRSAQAAHLAWVRAVLARLTTAGAALG